MSTSLSALLLKILKLKGLDVLDEPAQLKGLMLDLSAAEDSKVISLFFHNLTADMLSEMKKASLDSSEALKLTAGNVRFRMEDEFGVGHDTAQMLVDSLHTALCTFNGYPIPEQRAQTPAPQPAKATTASTQSEVVRNAVPNPPETPKRSAPNPPETPKHSVPNPPETPKCRTAAPKTNPIIQVCTDDLRPHEAYRVTKAEIKKYELYAQTQSPTQTLVVIKDLVFEPKKNINGNGSSLKSPYRVTVSWKELRTRNCRKTINVSGHSYSVRIPCGIKHGQVCALYDPGSVRPACFIVIDIDDGIIGILSFVSFVIFAIIGFYVNRFLLDNVAAYANFFGDGGLGLGFWWAAGCGLLGFGMIVGYLNDKYQKESAAASKSLRYKDYYLSD